MTKTGPVTLVYGPQGAGKTTHARRIAADTGAVIFSIDEWMRDLFAEDLSSGLDFAWIMARVRRCERRIWSVCAEILNSGGNVALDLGFMRRDDRKRFRSLATAAPCPIDLHFVDAGAGLRRQRVLARNVEKGATFSFPVTPAMFDFMERIYEPPDADERARSKIFVTG